MRLVDFEGCHSYYTKQANTQCVLGKVTNLHHGLHDVFKDNMFVSEHQILVYSQEQNTSGWC